MKQGLLWVWVAGLSFSLVACQKTKESSGVSARNLRTGEVVKFDSSEGVPADYVVCADKDCLQLLPPPPSTEVSCAAGSISISDCSGGLVPVMDETGCVVRYDCVPRCQEGKCPANDQICDRTCEAADPGLCIHKPAACPDVLRPVCGCDGKQYQNDCLRLVVGVGLKNQGACLKKCGPFPGGQCAADEVCNVENCLLGGKGECVQRPQACPEIWAPVCGCDGKTYDNDCSRLGAGVSRKSEGECVTDGPCGPFPGGECAADEVCDIKSCMPGGSGKCVKRPEVCNAMWAPVCGCDGQTYGNDCERLGAGAAFSAQGECAAADLKWYNTCGDPVCQVNPAPSTLPACTASQGLGKPCTKEGEMCDFGGGCGVKRVCAKKDPSLGPCPISNRSKKSDIRYLSDEALQGVASEVARIRLAEYRYNADPQGKTHLGFIIEDMPESGAVAAEKNMVDLYGYTSMVVAALQVQKKVLDEQKREIDALRKEIQALSKKLPRR